MNKLFFLKSIVLGSSSFLKTSSFSFWYSKSKSRF